MSRAVDVYLQRRGRDVRVGRAFLATSRRGISSTFSYADSYLSPHERPFAIDPALALYAGTHAIAEGLPPAFADSAPDRWGRNLIRKHLHAIDAEAGRTRRTVPEVDYLLGVADKTRLGALRFSDPEAGSEGPFLAAGSEVPQLIALPQLLRAAEQVERTPTTSKR